MPSVSITVQTKVRDFLTFNAAEEGTELVTSTTTTSSAVDEVPYVEFSSSERGREIKDPWYVLGLMEKKWMSTDEEIELACTFLVHANCMRVLYGNCRPFEGQGNSSG